MGWDGVGWGGAEWDKVMHKLVLNLFRVLKKSQTHI